jgi:Rod binding domain-containing protein
MTALPPIDNSLLPADVRKGTTADQNRYKTALAFERQLVEQLTQSMAETTKAQEGSSDSDAGSDGSSASTDSYKQMLPGVMADSIMSAGGLGLAATIANGLKESGK